LVDEDDEEVDGIDADTLFGGLDDDDLWGGRGPDTAHGGNGEDLAYGQEGADTLKAVIKTTASTEETKSCTTTLSSVAAEQTMSVMLTRLARSTTRPASTYSSRNSVR
jgi:hypothetical protein